MQWSCNMESILTLIRITNCVLVVRGSFFCKATPYWGLVGREIPMEGGGGRRREKLRNFFPGFPDWFMGHLKRKTKWPKQIWKAITTSDGTYSLPATRLQDWLWLDSKPTKTNTVGECPASRRYVFNKYSSRKKCLQLASHLPILDLRPQVFVALIYVMSIGFGSALPLSTVYNS